MLFLLNASRSQWRKSAKWSLGGGGDEEEEEEEEAGDGEDGEGEGAAKATNAPVYDGPDRVTIESLSEALLEDEYIGPVFTREIEVPKTDAPEGGDDDDEEDEEED